MINNCWVVENGLLQILLQNTAEKNFVQQLKNQKDGLGELILLFEGISKKCFAVWGFEIKYEAKNFPLSLLD